MPAGRVLEVGVGTGKNFAYHPRGATMTGIDLADRMLVRAKARAQHLDKTIDLREMDAQALTFPDNSFDAAVATCVFCSVPDPVRGLQELARGQAGRPHLSARPRPHRSADHRNADGLAQPSDRASVGCEHQPAHRGKRQARRASG